MFKTNQTKERKTMTKLHHTEYKKNHQYFMIDFYRNQKNKEI
jgi:hypothetical protein